MPLYEYECPEGHKHERYVSVATDRLAKVGCRHPGCERLASLIPSPSHFGGFPGPKESDVAKAIRRVRSLPQP